MSNNLKKYKHSEFGRIPEFFGTPIPANLYELYFLPKLIDKVPLYIQKIHELEQEISKFSDVESMADFIFRAFFLDLENRPYEFLHSYGKDGESFDIKFEKRRINWGEIISNRNLSCEICEENRTVDKCHIIPRKFGGTLDFDNIIILCPTHHRLLDKFMLSPQEYAAIDWSIKSPAAQSYANSTILENHKKFWDKISKHNYAPILLYENIEWPIYKFTLDRIMEIFQQKPVISKENIFMVLDKNIHEMAKGIITIMLKKGILKKDKDKHYLVLVDKNFHSTDEFATRCWQELN